MENQLSAVNKFYNETPVFLDELIRRCKEERIVLHGLAIDHVCLRVSNDLMYTLAHDELIEHGAKKLVQNDIVIGGRKISLWKMPAVIEYENEYLDEKQYIDILELPAKKDALHVYKDGIQHAEFYPIHAPATESAAKFIELYIQKSPFTQRGLDFRFKYNPMISHMFNPDLEIKIHAFPIDQVVKYEQNLPAHAH